MLSRLFQAFVPFVALVATAGTASAAPLTLDSSQAYFADDAEAGTINDKYVLEAPAGDTNSSIEYSNSQAEDGSRSIRYLSSANNSRRKIIPKSFGNLSSDTSDYGISVDIFIPSGVTQNQVLAFRPKIDNVTRPIQVVDNGSDGTTALLRIFKPGGGIATVAVDRDTWVNVQLDHLSASAGGRADLYVNGSLFFEGLYPSSAGRLTRLEFGSESNAVGEVFYDNVLVAPVVPEPGTLSLGLLGGLCLLARRSNKTGS